MMPGSPFPEMSALTPGEPKSILLIDDDDLIAGSLRQVLQMEGWEVDVAVDRPSSAALMTNRSYDLVLVDPYLTGGLHGEGGDLIAHVRTLQPEANLVVLTGYRSPDLDRSASDGRVSAILTKPQSVVFLGQFLVAASSRAAAPQPSIEGQPA
jgi:DNA-binding NtrC family response regulator